MFDGLFNFPDASFIFVHKGYLIPTSNNSEWDSDEDGYPIPHTEVWIETKGYATSAEPTRDGRTDRVDCVFLLPNDVLVKPADLLVIPQQQNLLPSLGGRYKLLPNGIRPNPLHTRLLLTRPRDVSLQDNETSVAV